MSTRILLLVANAGSDDDAAHDATALADLADAWEVLDDAGCEVLLVTPAGGAARAGGADAAASAWAVEPARRALLARTAAPGQVDAGDFDAVVCLASGAGALDDVVHGSAGLERIARSVAAHGGVVAAARHDGCALALLADRVADAAGDASASDVARAVARALTTR
ncbi:MULTISPECIES: hypothetical protein [unclassified Agrococcus]|uniref:hypothetical protein n=1 Tax=unclassified Agrococcus TaxID=2615065 RepID=UPI00360641CF